MELTHSKILVSFNSPLCCKSLDFVDCCLPALHGSAAVCTAQKEQKYNKKKLNKLKRGILNDSDSDCDSDNDMNLPYQRTPILHTAAVYN